MDRIILRNFEDRDVEFVYRSKNTSEISQFVMGDYKEYSYEDAEKWVSGCMQESSKYKFWAIAENDDFQNIIGWCGLSEIDRRNSSALFHGITINNPLYQDGIACYQACLQVLEYVFENLKLNRLFTSCLDSHKFSTTFIESIFLVKEGVLRKAFYKGGEFHDLLLYAILKDEYYEAKLHGEFNLDSVLSKYKKKLKIERCHIENLCTFVESFKTLEPNGDLSFINPQTQFKSLDMWSSLFAIEMVTMIEKSMGVSLNINDIAKIETIEELYNYARKRREGLNDNIPSWEAYEGGIY